MLQVSFSIFGWTCISFLCICPCLFCECKHVYTSVFACVCACLVCVWNVLLVFYRSRFYEFVLVGGCLCSHTYRYYYLRVFLYVSICV